jgi:hypothetical protein
MTFCCFDIKTPLDMKNKKNDLFVCFTMLYDGGKKITFDHLDVYEDENLISFYMPLKKTLSVLVEDHTILATNVISKESIKEFEHAKKYLLECVDYLNNEIVRSKKHQKLLCTHPA